MRNLLIASFYIFPAIALAVLAPVLPPVRPLAGIPGWGAGLFMLIAGGLLHVALALRGVRVSRDRRLARLAHENALMRQELDAAREEISTLHERIDSMPDSSHVVAELKIMQGLLGQLSSRASVKEAGEKGREIKEKTGAAELSAAGEPEKALPAEAELPPVAARAVQPAPAHRIDDAELLAIVEQALREDRVDIYLQPVVTLPARKRQFYECFSRIIDDRGRIITPERYIPLAEAAGLVAVIDNMLLFRCIQLVRRAARATPDLAFFCNISNTSLTDVDFFTDFMEFLADNRNLVPHLLFEFEQEAIIDPSYETRVNLGRLRDLGFHFSLDQVRRLDMDLPYLADLGFRYIKVGAHMLHEMARGEDPVLDMRRFKGELDRSAMDLIVEKIETEDMLRDLLDLRIDFGQGYLFGEPRPVARPDE